MELKKFNGIDVSSKFAICGLPIRVDTYKTCSFGCAYCFSNNREVCKFSKDLQVADIKSVERKLNKVLDKRIVDENNFLDTLIANGIDWHMGGMSDPFQPAEGKYHITKQLLDLTNKYGIHMLISTKSDTTYECDIRPELHTFQLSVTNVNNRIDIEPGVPSIENRLALYRSLKERGFKVGIRIQPFIPGITTTEIIEMFPDADNFTLEGIKLVPQNKEHKEACLKMFDLQQSDFKQMGLLNLKPELRLKMYQPFIKILKEKGISYSIADNDLHYLGTNKCCCGDALVHKASKFNNTTLIYENGCNYSKECLDKALALEGVANCKCNQFFTSNRQEGCTTVQEFYDKRFGRKSSPFSPLFQYRNV